MRSNEAQRTVAVAVSLLETINDMTAADYEPKHVQRMVRCACWLLCAHSDAHLHNDKEQDSE